MSQTVNQPEPRRSRLIEQVAGTVFFLALSVVAVRVFLALFQPPAFEPPTPPVLGYDRATMMEAVSPAAVRAEQDTIASLGNRYLGDPGFYKTEEYIRDRYTKAGLQIFEQDLETAVPRTERAEVMLPDGSPAPVKIYPMLPNHFQPIATPPEGVSGILLPVDDEVLNTRRTFDDCIALIDGSKTAPVGYGYSYSRYAQLGFKGIVVTDTEGFEEFNWANLDAMASITPVNYLRVVADPGISQYANQRLTFHVTVKWQNTPNRTVVGVLKSGSGDAREALVIPTSYDALSCLPDMAPGIPQALETAIQLKLLDGLLPYRQELRRDVIFIAFGGRVMASSGVDDLLRAIGASNDRGGRKLAQEAELAENGTLLEAVEAIRKVVDKDDFLASTATSVPPVEALPEAARKLFDEQYQYVLNRLVFQLSEGMLQTKIVFEKTDTSNLNSPEFAAYQATKKKYDDAFSAAGYQLQRLIENRQEYIADVNLKKLLTDRFAELEAFHRHQDKRLRQNLALLELFHGYRNLAIVSAEFTAAEEKPEKETITYSMGRETLEKGNGQVMMDALLGAIGRLDLDGKVAAQHFGPKHNFNVDGKIQGRSLEAPLWCRAYYPAYSLVNLDRTYRERGFPVELPYMRNTESLDGALQVAGECMLSIAFGNGTFAPLQVGRSFPDLYGSILVSNVGQSIIPNFPLAHALIGDKWNRPTEWRPKAGYINSMVWFSDVYGRYRKMQVVGNEVPDMWNFTLDAVGYDETGRITVIKDQGLTAQNIFRSTKLRADTLQQETSVVCFRAAPVSIFDLINPQSLKSYTGVELIRRKGLSSFSNLHEVKLGEGMITTFIKPDEYFYVKLKAGSAENEKVQSTRAFMLGVTDADLAKIEQNRDANIRMGNEIRGRGYLAQETEFLLNVPDEVAKSMLYVNEQRLKVQEEYSMADQRTADFHSKGRELLHEADEGNISKRQSLLYARDAVTYATLNHPILLSNIYEAIWGVLWYLGLLVPFVFFFEKLIFGFTDIRKQLTANVIIFLVAFGLLWKLHPAFSMIRSSLMILLGFIILLIATGIIFLFSSRFKENLEGIKKARGRVTEAEVNKLGAIAIAFMLGLNNMHRRRVRTLLTCGTLILITFVLICFTSIQSDIVETSQAVGKAPYQGFLVKDEKYRPVSEGELFALRTKYGQDFSVVPRYVWFGEETWDTRERFYPQLEIAHKVGDKTNSVHPQSILRLAWDEPLAAGLGLGDRWFTKEQETAANGTIPILISRKMADKLQISEADVDAGSEGAEVTIGGEPFIVQGIFDGSALDNQLDLDGRNLLPFDIKALREVNKVGEHVAIAEDEDPQVSGSDVIIAPLRSLGVTIPHGYERIVSIAVVLPPTLSYRDTKSQIEQYMEQSGRSTYYGLDKYSFSGMRARKRTFTGMLDMLIPLIIAAMTVLNTIRGSVFERREEIFVYNAVGIAPVYVFFMFFAEAFVYSVVGSVLGYLLSQGTGTILTALGLTGGLNMTFTSISTVFVSIIIMIVVLMSTFLPARTAKRIAAPTRDLGWKLPKPEDNQLKFRLPFTFNHRDRVGVLAFFNRHFDDHGEGSSGSFFAGRPRLGLADHADELADDAYIPQITVQVWLKPFDLGVSQRIEIAMPTDPETGEFVAELTLTRVSGALDNWQRLNVRFIRLIRRHFLHWRAVPARERQNMHDEARRLLLTALGEKPGEPEAATPATPEATHG